MNPSVRTLAAVLAPFFVAACAPSPEAPPAAPPAPAVAEIPSPPSPSASPSAALATSADAGPTDPDRPAAGAAAAAAPPPEDAVIAACIKANKVSLCVPLFEGQMDDLDAAPAKRGARCTSSCIGEREARLAAVVGAQFDACKTAYVKSSGKRNTAKCTFPKPRKLKDARERSMRFQDALRAAVEKGDAASLKALDDTLPLMDAPWLAEHEKACTEQCRAAAAELLATPPSAPAKP